MSKKISFSDLFDFEDGAAVEKAIHSIVKLDESYSKLSANMQSNFAAMQKALEDFSKVASASLNKTDISNPNDKERIIELTKAVDILKAANEKLIATEKAISSFSSQKNGQLEKNAASFGEATAKVKLLRAEIEKLETANVNLSKAQGKTAIPEIDTNIAKLKKLRSELDTFADVDIFAGIREKAETELGSAVNEIRKLEAKIQELTGSQKETSALLSWGVISGDKVKEATDKMAANNIELIKAKDALAIMRAEAKSSTRELTNLVGSYTQMDETLKKLTKNYKAMSGSERDSPFGKEALALLDAYEAELKEIDAQMGKYNRNVGNYASGATSLRTELRAVTEQMAAMQVNSQAGGIEYEKLASRAAELKKSMNAVTAEIQNQAKGKSVLAGLSESVTGLVGVYGALQGAMALMGGDNKELQETMVKLQASFTLLNALTAVNTMLQKTSATNTMIMTALQKLNTIAVNANTASENRGVIARRAAAAAQWLLNIAQKANPAGAVLAVFVALAGAMAYFSSKTGAAAAAQTKLNEAQKLAIGRDDQKIESIKMQASAELASVEKELAGAKARKASVQEIHALETEILKIKAQSSEAQKTIIAEDISNIDGLMDKYDEAATALHKLETKRAENTGTLGDWVSNIFRVMTDADRVQIFGFMDYEQIEWKSKKGIAALSGYVDNLSAQIKRARSVTEENIKLEIDAEVTALEYINTLREMSKKDAIAAAELRLLLSRRDMVVEFEAAKALAKTKTDIELQGENLTSNERKLIREKFLKEIEGLEISHLNARITREKNILEAELVNLRDFSEDQLNIKTELAEKQRAIELNNAMYDESAKVLINAKADKNISDLTTERLYKLEDDKVVLKNRYIQIGLNNALAGTVEEYNLKTQLIENEREAEILAVDRSNETDKVKLANRKAIWAQELSAKKELERDKLRAEIESAKDDTLKNIDLEEIQNAFLIASARTSTMEKQRIKQRQHEIDMSRLDAEMDANQSLYDNDLISFKDYMDKKKDIGISYEREKLRKAQETAEGQKALEAAVIDAFKTSVNDLASFMSDNSSAKISSLELEKDRELALYEGNKDAQAAIEKRYNDRIRKEKKKQAIADKQLATFNAILDMYKSYNTNLASAPLPYGAIIAGLALAMGAVQVGMIQARPIPEFWRGSSYTPQGLAYVGEKGTEVIEYQQKKYITDSTAQLVNLPLGARVYPNWHSESQNAQELINLRSWGSIYDGRQISDGKRASDISDLQLVFDSGAISKAFDASISKMTLNNFYLDENGFSVRTSRLADKTDRQHKRNTTGGHG